MFFSLTQPQPPSIVQSGMGWIDTTTLEAEPTVTHNLRFIQAGSIIGRHRQIHAGGAYVATPMHAPFSGVAIVEAEGGAGGVPILRWTVSTNLSPQRVIWVPNAYTSNECPAKDEKDDSGGLSTGATIGISVAVIVNVGALLALMMFCCCKKPVGGKKVEEVKESSVVSENSKAEKSVQSVV